MEVAGERGPPALLEDGLVERFDVAVGLGPAGADAGEADAAKPLDRVGGSARPRNSVAVVGEYAFEPPAGGASSRATRRASGEVCVAVGCPLGQLTSSAQA